MDVNSVFYIAPEMGRLPEQECQSALLCASPVPGGNEGLIYEEW